MIKPTPNTVFKIVICKDCKQEYKKKGYNKDLCTKCRNIRDNIRVRETHQRDRDKTKAKKAKKANLNKSKKI